VDNSIVNTVSTKKKIILLVASSMTVMSGATIAPALPLMLEYFSKTPRAETLVPLIFTIPALFIAIFSPLQGYFTDRVGRKPVLVFSLIVYGIAGSAGLYLDSIIALLISRAIMGIAVGGILTCTTTLIADYFSGGERDKFMGAQSAFIGLGGICFLLAGGFLAGSIGWHGPFYVYLLALVATPFAILWITEPDRISRKSSESSDQKLAIPWIPVFSIYILSWIGMILFYLIPVELPFYLKQLISATPVKVGISIALWTMFSAITSLLYRRIRQRWSFNAIFALMFFLISIGYYTLAHATDFRTVVLGLFFSGLGFGLIMPNVNILISSLAPEFARGRLIGGLSTSFFLGQFCSPLIAGLVITQNGFSGNFGAYGSGAILSIIISIGFIVSVIFVHRDFKRNRI
jgi:MFS family permease